MKAGIDGRVRMKGRGIGVTLGGTEYDLTMEQAIGLAGAIIETVTDGKERNMQKSMPAFSANE